MKLYTVEFEPMWPVPCALVILAEDLEEATKITALTITHDQRAKPIITEIPMDKSGVVLYESGDY